MSFSGGADQPHRYCVGDIQDAHSLTGVEVIVMAIPPQTFTVWTKKIECPHGHVYWVEPTPDQFNRWLLAGIH